MKAVIFLSLLLVGFCTTSPSRKVYNPVSEEFIFNINKRATTWKAGKNFDENTPLEELRKRMGLLPARNVASEDRILIHDFPDIFPRSLDLREKWSNCSSLQEIRNQGACGSCWAFASVEVMTDRECIHSNGKRNFHYSAQDLTSCCDDCGSGCSGGYLETPYNYWSSKGIVSGGPYNSSEGCSPYLIPDDNQDHSTPVCQRKCQDKYDIKYNDDLHFGRDGYYHVHGTGKNIMHELYKNGPVSAGMTVYDDFLDYKSGVYIHKDGEKAGGHAIKIIGYGEENETPYWLCANSWGEEWGDKGFFKILRGRNHCGIEGRVIAGLPKRRFKQ